MSLLSWFKQNRHKIYKKTLGITGFVIGIISVSCALIGVLSNKDARDYIGLSPLTQPPITSPPAPSKTESTEDIAKNYYYLGVAHYNAGRYNEAIVAFKQVLVTYDDAKKVKTEYEANTLYYLVLSRSKISTPNYPLINKEESKLANLDYEMYDQLLEEKKRQHLVRTNLTLSINEKR